jgi:hypothetical protein
MSPKAERSLAIAAALLILFGAMWDPRISVTVSIVALLALSIYKSVYKSR